MVRDAVLCERVSGLFSLLYREFTGKSSFFGRYRLRKTPVNRRIPPFSEPISLNTEQGIQNSITGNCVFDIREIRLKCAPPKSHFFRNWTGSKSDATNENCARYAQATVEIFQSPVLLFQIIEQSMCSTFVRGVWKFRTRHQ